MMDNSGKTFEFGEINSAADAPSENPPPDKLTQAELEPALSANVARSSKSVAIIGGGLAGMAAAAILCEHGLQVDLFEQSDRLGGRAGSMEEPWNHQVIDQCQHVAMGCCGSFLDFCRRTGVEDCFQRHKMLHFIGPDGRQSDITAAAWLPAPFHLLPGFFRLKYLTWRECWSIFRTLRKLIRLKIYKEYEIEIVRAWLRRHGQSESEIRNFWSVVLTSALSETVDYASLAAAKKVFADGFCASRHAYELVTPRVPLGEIFDRRVPEWLERQGVKIHRGARAAEIAFREKGEVSVFLYNGNVQDYDSAIVAVPWFEAPNLFSASPANPPPKSKAVILSSSTANFLMKLVALKQIPFASITAVHLWFDRPITQLPHAALVGKLSQWIFNNNSYCQVVISASHRIVIRYKQDELLKIVLADLAAVFPDARQATLLNSRIVTMPRAVISLQPGVDQLRPSQKTGTPNLFLAGDWTATGWPSTMEGAVRSGYLAAEELLKYLGQ
ncbi:MAG: hydroxysqualene dehydroxylase HpnE [Thermoguttaceae bacterium]|jgi:squalene-associated FAD-dependent desaturase